MTKKTYEVAEWYPIWLILDKKSDDPDLNIDIPKDKLKWIEQTNKEFDKTQEYLNKIINGAI